MAELVAVEPALFRTDEAWFVYDDGRKYLRKRERPEPPPRSAAIARDSIDPCRGADMRMHDSLSSLRRSYRASGNPQGVEYTEIGNETIKAPEPPRTDRRQMRDHMRAAISDVRNGRVAPPVILKD
jgi:hypothetical protein